MCTIRMISAMIFILLTSCNNEQEVAQGAGIVFTVPDNFPPATYTLENNAVTEEGFQLGRMLFYDPILSMDSTVSCSTCHKHQTAFADPTHRINHGINNRFGKRNSPAITNMAFMDFFFFDGGVNHLDFVPINAITSEVEMGNTLDEVTKRLTRSARYAPRFKSAFKKDKVDSQQVLHALAQFTVMLVSANSKYDQVTRGKTTFTAEELEGFELFENKCATCHTPPLFTDRYFRNNGLDNDFSKDNGREHITALSADRGKFKVPALRNVALTPPFMHDGRFNSLEDVLDHYATGVKDSPSLDPLLSANNATGIPMTDDEKKKIIQFLGTLSDGELLRDKRFTDPFQ